MTVRCRIARLSLPPGHRIDTGDLARQIERELALLLELSPVPSQDNHVAAPADPTAPRGATPRPPHSDRVTVEQPLSTHTVAAAVARHVHGRLTGGKA